MSRIKDEEIIRGKRELIKEYINLYPHATYREIRRDTKIKIERIFKNMCEAYNYAGVDLPLRYFKRNREKQKEDVIKYIQENPRATVLDLYNNVGVGINRVFGSIEEAYRLADVPYPEFLRLNTITPELCRRAKNFEALVYSELAKICKIEKQVSKEKKRVDAIIKLNNEEIIVEIKDFLKNKIGSAEIRQLGRYMELFQIKKGIIITRKCALPSPSQRNIYKKDQFIKVISLEELRGCGVKVKLTAQSGSIMGSNIGAMSFKQ